MGLGAGDLPWLPLCTVRAPRRWFLSYPSVDAILAHEIETRLTGLGMVVWRDQSRLTSANNWLDAILAALVASDGVVALLTRRAAQSEIIRVELEHASRLKLPIHVFTDFDLRLVPSLYAVVGSLHFVHFPANRSSVNERVDLIVSSLTGSDFDYNNPDPLAYLRCSATVIVPIADALALDRATARTLLAALAVEPMNPWQALNLALLEAELGHWDRAREHLQGHAFANPRAAFHAATVLLAGRAPHTLEASADGDEIDRLLTSALTARRSPLIAIFIGWFRVQSRRASGPAYRALVRDALAAIAPEDGPEFRRWIRLTRAVLNGI
nr:toll/interleukin-1 receptor domain-containing protein [Ralstonia sp.]